ncbi:hypothetical protein Nepgr_030982 [Nepenthes gracilis]|uniref:Phenylalanyl-tRNA synthetase domain-containing protein n=1 Tax=Nepenthes gracilis TaxID=150966 RepID=A0AAD3TH77_NEPGR|nr:hypothetical protein Nepgr_030982 [Nepenthes gracilis]
MANSIIADNKEALTPEENSFQYPKIELDDYEPRLFPQPALKATEECGENSNSETADEVEKEEKSEQKDHPSETPSNALVHKDALTYSVPPMSDNEHGTWGSGLSMNGDYFPDGDLGWNQLIGEDKELTMWDVVTEMLFVAGRKVRALASGNFNRRQMSWISANLLDQVWKEMAQTLNEVGILSREKSIPDAILRQAKGLAILTVAKAGAVMTYKVDNAGVIVNPEGEMKVVVMYSYVASSIESGCVLEWSFDAFLMFDPQFKIFTSTVLSCLCCFGISSLAPSTTRDEANKNLLRTHTTAVSSRMLYALAQDPVSFRNCVLNWKIHSQSLYHEGFRKWVEIGNSGMFRPEMLLPMGLPEDVRVIAWGLSLERPTMILYGIDNIRDLFGHKMK